MITPDLYSNLTLRVVIVVFDSLFDALLDSMLEDFGALFDVIYVF